MFFGGWTCRPLLQALHRSCQTEESHAHLAPTSLARPDASSRLVPVDAQRANPHCRCHCRHGHRQLRRRRSRRRRAARRRADRHRQGDGDERLGRVPVSRFVLRIVPTDGDAPGLSDGGVRAGHSRIFTDDGSQDQTPGRLARRAGPGQGHHTCARNDVERHLDDREQQGAAGAAAERAEHIRVRAADARHADAREQRQYALQRDAGRHHQRNDRRHQQRVKWFQERGHELLRDRGAAAGRD